MRIKPEESFEEWAERVHSFELDQARKDLAKGLSIDEVLEAMSNRIQQKLMHPILKAIKENKTDYNAEASKKAYEEAYLKKNGPKADHLTDD